jgi:glycosyltransferase involved in cell wall biosynthesis
LAELGYWPLVVIRNFSMHERRAVEKELAENKYDLIHAEAFYVMPHIPNTDIPIILVEQTIEFMVYKHYMDTKVPMYLKPFYLLDVVKLKFWEKHYWGKADRLVAVSSEDRNTMREQIPGINVDIIPNGVDAGHYDSAKYKVKSPPRVLYGVTNFEWLQNVEAVDMLINDVWPEIHKGFPSAKLWIVGRKIPQEIVELSEKRDDIEITESIEEAREAYKSSYVMVTPIKGSGGTRLKILEALAAGLPVVSTSVGVAGLGLTNGKQALIKDTMHGLAQETIKLLKDSALADKIGKAGREFVKEHFDWKVIGSLHDDIYEKVIKK